MESVGSGGTGIVYKAEDVLLNVPVAIKVLKAEVTANRQIIAELKAETRMAMRLSHHHIGRLHDLQTSDGRYFVVTEYIKGSTLRELLGVYGYFQIDSMIEVLKVLSDALSYAHRHGVLHKNLKPENIMLTDEGVLKITDFGISCLVNPAHRGLSSGNPAYMSPERLQGGALDLRTDVYALAMIAYEMLVGALPFPPQTPAEELHTMLPPRLSGVPAEIGTVLARALAIQPEARWESVAAFVTRFIQVATPFITPTAP